MSSSIEAIGDAFWHLLVLTGNALRQVPGMWFVVDYIERSYQNDPFRMVLEGLVLLFAINYLFNREKKESNVEKLTEKEIEELIEEWQPEPLVVSPPSSLGDKEELERAPVIDGEAGLHVTLTTGEKLDNWACHNFLGLQNGAEIAEAAIRTVREYGVGACGPPGFYGSMDVHLNLEKELAKALDMDEAIVYAQGLMAVSSVIPAFAKRGDIIVADSSISFAGQIGLEISRSVVHFFEHNNMWDLERILKDIDAEWKKKKIPLTRRFILVEGLYAKTGDKCPLPELLRLKKQYKYRLIVDESLSFACLGPRGLGISDHYGILAREIDIIAGSFNNSLGSSGGFCAGSSAVIDHQRLSSQAYCFSAALPPLLAVATSVALKQIMEAPQCILSLKRNTEIFNNILIGRLPPIFSLVGDKDSPLRFLQLTERLPDGREEGRIVDEVISEMRKNGFLITRSKYVASREKFIPPPSAKICISAGFTEDETEKLSKTLLNVLYQMEKP